MSPLPPPDPHEPTGEPPGLELTAPAVVYVGGTGALQDPLADAVLAARPGALFVVAGSD
jgi:hypothetical protein